MEKGKRKVRSGRKRSLGFLRIFIIQALKRISDFGVKILLKILFSVVQDFHGIFHPREVELQLSKFETHVGGTGGDLSDDLPKLL